VPHNFYFHGKGDRTEVPWARTTFPRIASSRKPSSRSATVIHVLKAVVIIALVAILLLFVLTQFAKAGGPKYVAGSSFFDPTEKGVPLTWEGGSVNYYTDQGDLSPLVQHAAADSLVATAFDRWASVSTVALATTLRGQLAEDVNGTNVTSAGGGVITMPADIQPSATGTPIAIVYDADGTVTDALLGTGASSLCFSNRAFGGLDSFTTDGHFAHALVIMDGVCAQSSSQLPDLQYQLVRVLGRVLGLDWSQLNVNAITGTPPPTSQDYAGFPVMHAIDPIACVPVSLCYPSADQPKMDDRAAISRLYPVTPANQSSFPGKLLFTANTARIHGKVSFVDKAGVAAQGMQGVNVVARWIDPANNQRSRQYAASSVSGFLFRGNAGNPITGYTDPAGQLRDRFGTDDTTMEGFFDLAGLEFPNGANTANYELTVEALDTTWSPSVGPYPWQVTPSGNAQPVIVTVTRGADVQQDILMSGSALELPDVRSPETYDVPAPVTAGGDWMGSLTGYSDADYFRFTGQANRTLSVEVSALDETGALTQNKARPVIGIWGLASPAGTDPGALTPSAFNVANFGMSRLEAMLLASTDFRIGVADERGDGRPDYRYRIRVLYGDKVTPSRTRVNGGTVIAIDGFGFRADNSVTVAQQPATVLWVAPNRIIAQAPAAADGVQTVVVSDSATGGSSRLTDALTVGAGPNDAIVLLAGSNPSTPVGTPAANPIRVQVIAPDGITPVSGASVNFSVSPTAGLSACAGASACTVLTDATGEASTLVTPSSASAFTITASLAPASYSPAKYVQTTVVGRSSSLDIAVLSPYRWVAQSGNADLPVLALVVNNGSPVSGKTVNFAITVGNGTLTASSATTNSSGLATTTLQVRTLAGDLRVSACVAPNNSPCATLCVSRVLLSALGMLTVSGNSQMISVGQAFQPVVVRVVDSSLPPNPVQGASVTFWSMMFRPDYDVFNEPIGETGAGTTAMPIILASTQTALTSDANGLASLTPSPGSIAGAVEIEVMATAGLSGLQQFELESIWMLSAGSNTPGPGGTTTLLPAKRPIWICPNEDDSCSSRALERVRRGSQWRARRIGIERPE
jgi:IPT/TIG domain